MSGSQLAAIAHCALGQLRLSSCSDHVQNFVEQSYGYMVVSRLRFAVQKLGGPTMAMYLVP